MQRQLTLLKEKKYAGRKVARPISTREYNHVVLKSRVPVLRRNHCHMIVQVGSRKEFANALRFFAGQVALRLKRGRIWRERAWSRMVKHGRDLAINSNAGAVAGCPDWTPKPHNVRRQSVDDIFESALQSALNRALGSGAPAHLAESVRYSLLAPGKRIRLRLCLETAKVLGVATDAATAAAIAIEMIHCFSLIHDDLPCMDNDDFRRGKPSNHKVYGEALALLAGDALVGMAIQAFCEAQPALPADRFQNGLATFLKAIGPEGIIGGQALELKLDASSTLEDLRRVHAMKTGALFVASILVPANFGGLSVSDPAYRALEQFAHALGELFQVADDLADREQDRLAANPSTILRFLTPEEALSLTEEHLAQSRRSLQAQFGHARSESLLQFAASVLQRTKK